jgi:transaldolase
VVNQQRKVKIYADGADLRGMVQLASDPRIDGFTTNPTLMNRAGVSDYEAFAHQVLEHVRKPISFEVFSDDFDEMGRQARVIASWGPNVYVKIPVTDTHGESSTPLVKELAGDGLQLNVTAVMTLTQVEDIASSLSDGPGGIVSVFAGRIADTGRDPIPVMKDALSILADHAHLELLWASPREILNLRQAQGIGCHIITLTHDLLDKLPSLEKDLELYSLETVQMFHRDAMEAGYIL